MKEATKMPSAPPPDIDPHRSAGRIARNSAYMMVSRVIGVVLTFIAMAFACRYLDRDGFGIYAFVLAVSMAVKPIVDFGFGSVLCRDVASDQYDSPSYVSTAFGLKLILAALVFSVGYVVSPSFVVKDVGIKMLAVGIAGEMVLSVGQAYLQVIRAHERMEFELVVNILHKLTIIVLYVIVSVMDLGLMAIMMARLAAAAVHALSAAVLLYGKFIELKFVFSMKYAVHLMKESWPVAIATLAFALIIKVDVFLLKMMDTPAAISLFEIPHGIVGHIQMVSTAICIAAFPMLSRMETLIRKSETSEEKDKNLRLQWSSYRNAYKFLILCGVMFGSVLFVGGRHFVTLVFSAKFSDAALPLMILAPTVTFLFMSVTQDFLLLAKGHQKLNMLSLTLALMLNVVLDIYLIPKYSYIGASIGTLISYFVLMLLGAYWVRRTGMVMNLWGFMIKVLIAGAASAMAIKIRVISPAITVGVRWIVAVSVYLGVVILLKAVGKDDIRFVKEVFLKRGGRRRENLKRLQEEEKLRACEDILSE